MFAFMTSMRPALKTPFERSYANCTTALYVRQLTTRLRQPEDFSEAVVRRVQKKSPNRRGVLPLGLALKPSQSAYTDLVYKWFLEAYPESLSRQEIAARLGAKPRRIRSMIIQPLLEEGKIFKWGQKVMPFERYLPNVKAPEYYEVTGESPPAVPDVDESALLLRNQAPAKRAAKSEDETSETEETDSELNSFQQALLTEDGPEEEEAEVGLWEDEGDEGEMGVPEGASDEDVFEEQGSEDDATAQPSSDVDSSSESE